MRSRNKWIVSLLFGGMALSVVACARPVATSADVPGEGYVARTENKPGPQESKPADPGKQQPSGSKQGSEGQQEPTTTAAVFPGDQGGTLMKRLLAPRDSVASAQAPTAPLRRKPLDRVENPALPLPGFEAVVPRVSLYGPLTNTRPVFVLPEHFLGDAGLLLALPEVQTMATGPLLKVPSVDVNKPSGLAPLAQPLASREPTIDPTKPHSGEAALRAAMPVRTNPASFTPESVPDPFENELAVRKLAPPADESLPLSSGSQAPKK